MPAMRFASLGASMTVRRPLWNPFTGIRYTGPTPLRKRNSQGISGNGSPHPSPGHVACKPTRPRPGKSGIANGRNRQSISVANQAVFRRPRPEDVPAPRVATDGDGIQLLYHTVHHRGQRHFARLAAPPPLPSAVPRPRRQAHQRPRRFAVNPTQLRHLDYQCDRRRLAHAGHALVQRR